MTERERWDELADALAAGDALSDEERRFLDALDDPQVERERAMYEQLAAAGEPLPPSDVDRQRAQATLAAFRRARARERGRGWAVGLGSAALAVAASVLLWISWPAPDALDAQQGESGAYSLELSDPARAEEGEARMRRGGHGRTGRPEALPEPGEDEALVEPTEPEPTELEPTELEPTPAEPSASASKPNRTRAALPSASELLGAARRQVAAGEIDRALSTYATLRRQHPSSPEAHAANVSIGELELRRGRPQAALKAFSRYLSVGGSAGKSAGRALAEEAHWGKIRALHRLGRTADRDAAIDELRRAHPGSVYIGRASSL